ncbi:GNAT family N-acetyltransferase [Ornithinimicrobium pratense]|uniref:GNAT family N-acetyltransferase n=1 Tax=Ornithinimicrobium pratense TaxID=2593973 RepID=A0A5J6VAF9_9MICO|nr:GNAT family N-acetyltransferase [Ornithinimicrobium pratense]
MSPETVRVLLSSDPQCRELEARGWRVLAESWGARLRPSEEDLPRLGHLVTRARAHGYAVLELGPADAAEVAGLDGATREDYPRAGPATAHAPVDEAQAAAALSTGRGFGARDAEGALVAMSMTRSGGDRVETEFTAVHPDHRGAGLGTAVKAASVLAWWADGARVFGTGGAQTNPASMAINRAVGYTVTERWLTYAPGKAGSTS